MPTFASTAVLLATAAALLLAPCPTLAHTSTAAATAASTTTTAVPMTTATRGPGGFNREQLSVLIGIPVALFVIIIIGVIIGCLVLHQVHREEKLIHGKPHSDCGTDSGRQRQLQYYSDYLNSQTKTH